MWEGRQLPDYPTSVPSLWLARRAGVRFALEPVVVEPMRGIREIDIVPLGKSPEYVLPNGLRRCAPLLGIGQVSDREQYAAVRDAGVDDRRKRRVEEMQSGLSNYPTRTPSLTISHGSLIQ